MSEKGVVQQVFEVDQRYLVRTAAFQDPPSKRLTLWVGAYIFVLSLLLLYLLLKIWPGTVPFASPATIHLAWGSWSRIDLWIETRYLLIVLISGALGSFIHLATSFADYLGNRKFVASWTWWYLLRPFIGMTLATVVYFVLRAGLISGTSGAEHLSPYGVAATAGMCGLFSKQATDKLREVFENLFRTKAAPERADPLTSVSEYSEGKENAAKAANM